MVKPDKLEKIQKRAKLAQEMSKLNVERGDKLPLHMDIDADLKRALQKAYGRSLTALFEEFAVEKLRRDGYLPETKKAE